MSGRNVLSRLRVPPLRQRTRYCVLAPWQACWGYVCLRWTFAVLVRVGSPPHVQWGITYPMDVVKSRIQTLPDDAPRAVRSISHVMRTVWKEGGIAAFTVGLPTTLLRAIPSNAATFLTYEYALARLKQQFLD